MQELQGQDYTCNCLKMYYTHYCLHRSLATQTKCCLICRSSNIIMYITITEILCIFSTGRFIKASKSTKRFLTKLYTTTLIITMQKKQQIRLYKNETNLM